MSELHSKSLFVCEAGIYRTATHEETVQAAKQSLARKFRRGRSLTSPALMRDFLQMTLADREFETFGLVLMDNRHRLLVFLELFRGTIDGALYLASRLSTAFKCL